jgi:hypothetical protein
MATGTQISGFAGGAVLYQFGYTGVQRMSDFSNSSLFCYLSQHMCFRPDLPSRHRILS